MGILSDFGIESVGEKSCGSLDVLCSNNDKNQIINKKRVHKKTGLRKPKWWDYQKIKKKEGGGWKCEKRVIKKIKPIEKDKDIIYNLQEISILHNELIERNQNNLL